MNFNVFQIIILIMTFCYELTDVLNSQLKTSFAKLTVEQATKLIIIIVLSSIYKSIPLLLTVKIVCSPTAHI